MKYTNTVEIRDRRGVIRQQANDLIAQARKEVRLLTDEEQATLEAIKKEAQELDDEERAIVDALNAVENPVPETREEGEMNKNTTSNTRMEKRFSLLGAINAIANNQPLDDVSRAVIAAGAEEARRAGIAAQGQIQIPMNTEQRDIVSVTSEGEDLVPTDIWDIVTPLRARNVLAQAGARMYTNLVGNVQIPVMGATNVTWEGEIAPAKDGAPTFTHKTLSPKRLTAYIDVSKTLLHQTQSIDVEMALRNDLIAAINAKIEETVLGSAAGSATQPAGILSIVTPETVSDFADIVNLESEVDEANVVGDCAYVLSNKAKAAMRSMIKGTNGTGMVYENGEVDGTRAYNTSNVAAKNYIYGDWSNLVIGAFGGIDLIVDPYTKATENQIRIVVNFNVDAAVLREDAFVAGAFE